MLRMKKLLFLALLSLSQAIFASYPKITEIKPFDPLIAGTRRVTEAIIYGEGFFPPGTSSTAELPVLTQLNYRKIYPGLGPWQTAIIGRGPRPTNENSPIEISSIGPTSMQIAMFEGIVMHPGVWSFTYCVQSTGCSSTFEITVQAPYASATILDISKDAPVGKNYSLDIALEKLETFNPRLILGDKKLEGIGFPKEGRARFNIPPTFFNTPGLHNVAVYDKTVGVNSNLLMVVAFDVPKLKVVPNPIVQDLRIGQNPKDTVVELSFVPFKNPSEIIITDMHGRNHTVVVPRDLFTHKMKLAVPGHWLKIGESNLQLTLKNIAGISTDFIRTKISGVIVRPEPNPIPIPIPIPRPPR